MPLHESVHPENLEIVMSARLSAPAPWALPRPEDSPIALIAPGGEKQLGYRHAPLFEQKGDTLAPRRFAERLLANSLRSEADALGAS
jgi:hypothetical protein